MKTVIIDYGSGNLRSAEKALERAMSESSLTGTIVVTDNVDEVKSADRIVLPGVGAFRDCRNGLKAIPGMWNCLHEQVTTNARPFLGICVGMQLMAELGHEGKETTGFGWIPGTVEKITPQDPELKIPHMGWNTISITNDHPVFKNIKTGEDGLHAYFVHSYHFVTAKNENVLATCEYASTVTAMIGRDNLIGTQFHPEKSQKLGLALLSNFLTWSP